MSERMSLNLTKVKWMKLMGIRQTWSGSEFLHFSPGLLSLSQLEAILYQYFIEISSIYLHLLLSIILFHLKNFSKDIEGGLDLLCISFSPDMMMDSGGNNKIQMNKECALLLQQNNRGELLLAK